MRTTGVHEVMLEAMAEGLTASTCWPATTSCIVPTMQTKNKRELTNLNPAILPDSRELISPSGSRINFSSLVSVDGGVSRQKW